MQKRIYLLSLVLLCSLMTVWAGESTYNPTSDVFFRTNVNNNGWNSTSFPMTAADCGDGTFAGNVRVGMFVLQQYTVVDLQNASSIKLSIAGNKDQGPDALAIWTFTNDWSSNNDATNAETLAAAVQEKIGLALQSTGEPTGTPLINGTDTKTAIENDRICTFTFDATALAAIKAAATYEGSTGTFTLLLTNKTNEMSSGSSKDRKFYCSAHSNEAFRPTLTVVTETPVVTNTTTGVGYANLNDAFAALTGDADLVINDDVKLTGRLTLNQAYTVNITASKDVAIKGPKNAMWFLANVNDATLKIGSKDHKITFDGIGDDRSSFNNVDVTRRENNTKLYLTNIEFKDFTCGANHLVGCKNNGGAIYLEDITFTNCSSTDALVSNLREQNDALLLKGFLNVENCTGTTIYTAKNRIRLGNPDGTTIYGDFSASNVITIGWGGDFVEGTNVIVKVPVSAKDKFQLVSDEWILARNPNNGDMYMTKPAESTVKIGETTYADLTAALAAVQDGETITLLADQELSARVNVKNMDITITGNYAIKRAAGFNGLVMVTAAAGEGESAAALTLEGVTLDGISLETENAFIESSNNGTVTLKNVTIQNAINNKTSNTQGSIIVNKGGGVLVLDGVTFTNCTTASGTIFVGTNNVTLKGENTIPSIYLSGSNILNADNTTVTAPIVLTTESRSYGQLIASGTATQFSNSSFRLAQMDEDVYAMPLFDNSGAFAHPGLLHTAADITAAKGRLTQAPFASALARLKSLADGGSAGAVEYLKRMDQTNWQGIFSDYNNYTKAVTDAKLAYEQALYYQLSGNTAYANQAVGILNDWSTNCKGMFLKTKRYDNKGTYNNSIPDPNEYLACIQAYQFANAAELLRGYMSDSDMQKFQNWLRTTFADVAILFLETHNYAALDHYWANWDLTALTALYSVGVLCDDATLVNYAKNYISNGTGMGVPSNIIVATHNDPDSEEALGQCQESGRDQGHATLNVTLLGVLCQTAYNQGNNLFETYKALSMVEYIGKYNLKDASTDAFVYASVPYTSYTVESGTQNERVMAVISADSRGAERPAWELFHAYAKKNSKADKYTEAWVKYYRAKYAYGEGEGTNDELGFGTLMFGAEVSADDQPTITITAKAASRVYGEANPEFTYEISGGTAEQLGGTPVLTCEATATSGVGEYTIKVAKGTATYSNIVFVDGKLTVTKAPLTISGGTYTMVQGEQLPTFTATYEGFKNGETADVLTTKPTLTTSATSESAAGIYAVTVSGAEAQNYAITYISGQLTITPATGIDAVLTGNSHVVVYDLNGQRVKNPQKGVYLVNGKKVVIR